VSAAWVVGFLIVANAACAPMPRADTIMPAAAQASREIVINIRPQSVALAVGETLVARSSGMRWTASFDSAILALLSPGSDERGSSREWRFGARAAGTTDVTFTGDVTAPCPTPPDCPPPPSPPTVVVHVQVTQ